MNIIFERYSRKDATIDDIIKSMIETLQDSLMGDWEDKCLAVDSISQAAEKINRAAYVAEGDEEDFNYRIARSFK